MGNKGSRYERELVNKLWSAGFTVMRSPTSGGGRKQPQPDVLASDGTNTYALECKSSSDWRIYVAEGEVEQLLKFCEGFGAEPLIAVRFNYVPWKLLSPEKAERTEKSFKVTKSMAENKGVEIENL